MLSRVLSSQDFTSRKSTISATFSPNNNYQHHTFVTKHFEPRTIITFWTQKLSSLDKKTESLSRCNPWTWTTIIASSCILDANSSACHFWWASNMPEIDGLNLLLEGKHVLLIFCSKWFWTHLDHWVSTSASFVLCRCPLPSDNLCAGPVLHQTSWSLEEG